MTAADQGRARTTTGPLGLPVDDLASCVSCGLCLPHCPTFRVTGDETRSPRGRITAMRGVEAGSTPLDGAFAESMTTCVQCRGCETACPSGVPFGRLITRTRVVLEDREPHRLRAALVRTLAVPGLVRAGSWGLALAQRLRLLPSRLGLPARLPLRRPTLRPSGSDVWLFTGCVMDAWQRDVHVAVARVVESTGRGVALPGRGGACCGALALHSGMARTARRRARATMRSMPGTAPILVDSAGCGAALLEYGELLGSDEARRFSARVVDASSWLADHLGDLPPPRDGWTRPTLAVHDPCHLRHVQKAHDGVRRALAPFATTVDLDTDGLCCGAGGLYAALEPDLADRIRQRTLDSIARTGAPTTVSANPGCLVHLGRAGIAVEHPVSVVASALGVLEEDGRAR